MRTASLLLLLMLQAAAPDIACRDSRTDNRILTRTLTNGATITIQPFPPNELQQSCGIAVRDLNGKTVFVDRGFSTNVDAATGRDIDNDGQPDAVLGIDTLGGTNGSWEYPVISFSPQPRVLAKLPAAIFDFEAKPGRTLVWILAAFDGLSGYASDVSTVATAREFRQSGLVEVTRDYCKSMLAGELQVPGNLRASLATLTRQAKQDSRQDNGRLEDREDTRLAATSVVLQQIYCEQFNDASRLILEVWPATEQSRVRKQIRDAITNRWPELGGQLENWN